MDTIVIEPIMGLVLAGGRSRRMGVDKTTLRPFGPVGCTMIARAFALVSAFARPTFIACNGPLHGQFPSIQDLAPDYGPVAGIAAGLEKTASLGLDALLVMACDLPLISPAILRALLDFHRRSPKAGATFFKNGLTGRMETLVAVYNVDSIGYFAHALDSGERSLQKVIPVEKCAILPYGGELAPFFLNCNRPEDMLEAGKFGRMPTETS